ncbi:hypothetical protein [Streptococcus sanguinis]|uniref:Glucosyltransferase-I n=1 Tax=Streptococcus sanguinis TaxID=1305 RepID=A0A2X3V5Y5_STRSA|nr:hypothetical protein [Streptococcus sanguinis]EGJ44405.1 hypothetical protein HMPREF9396_0813 [Streptococcus sanguinis SK1059]EGQ20732.1 hypothetical protein HMPREF8573_0803 [Streptococcus sanguinis ATCC 29667]EGQ24091.1 hypothetical protein HMPREF9387_1359 [Streptococcus sanguinis SK340]SQF34678.1 glucosyltransferase-I [Streptococcus sanguinis]
MRQEKNTKAMFNSRYWLGLSLASAATLAAALISTGTVRAENKSIPDWASRREVGIYDPSVPDIEDDPTIFDDPGPIKVPEAPKREFPAAFYDESGEIIKNRIVLHEGKYYLANQYGDTYKIQDDPAEQIPTNLKNSFYTSPTGKVYYFDEKGRRVINLYSVDGKQYFFDSYGEMVKNRFVSYSEYTYYFGEDGTPYKNGLYKIGKYYYYFTEYGDLLRQGSFDYKGKTYYTNWHGVVNIKDEEVTP